MQNAIRSIINAKRYLLSPSNARIPIRVLRPFKKWMNNPMIPDFSCWHFDEGMKYGDGNLWWGKGVPRKNPHEGIDLYDYIGKNGSKKSILAATKVPNIYDGEIAAITKDDICSSVFVRHNIFSRGSQFFTIFGHIKVNEGLKEKDLINVEIILGEVADVPQGSHAFPHLHLSMAWIPEKYPGSQINWQNIDKRFFINPLQLFHSHIK